LAFLKGPYELSHCGKMCMLSLNTRKASLLKKKKTLELKTPPTERGGKEKRKTFRDEK